MQSIIICKDNGASGTGYESDQIKIIAVLLLLCISAAWLARYEIQESGQNLSGQMADKMKQNTDEPQNLYAQSAVLMDADSGRVLFGKEEEAISLWQAPQRL